MQNAQKRHAFLIGGLITIIIIDLFWLIFLKILFALSSRAEPSRGLKQTDQGDCQFRSNVQRSLVVEMSDLLLT